MTVFISFKLHEVTKKEIIAGVYKTKEILYKDVSEHNIEITGFNEFTVKE